MQRDEIDDLAAEAFEGFVVRKDLALRFKGQYPVPTYVGEFLLGRYCATTDEKEIAEGLEVVERLMGERTVRAGEEELFKARARERGRVVRAFTTIQECSLRFKTAAAGLYQPQPRLAGLAPKSPYQ